VPHHLIHETANPMSSTRTFPSLLVSILLLIPAEVVAQHPTATYWVYVGAESADVLHLIRFDTERAVVERTIPVGEMPIETEGPHGLRVSADGHYLYMTTGHGIPDGKLWKIETGSDTLVADPILLGRFPATIDLTPDGLYAFIVNFNLHGEHEPSTISVVYTPDLMEVKQTVACTQPHGGRMHPSGTRWYLACVFDDQLVEVDTQTFEVSRRFSVAKGREGSLDNYQPVPSTTSPSCGPTWAQPSVDGSVIFVACNMADQILEIDCSSWTVRRRFTTGRGPYNLDVTPDGKTLIATLKQGGRVQFFDIRSGKSKGVVESSTTVTHGVVASPDSRYAFVSVEGVGAEPGKVDIYDLQTLTRVADVDVAQQAGGIAFWKMEPASGRPK
jgi:DNA-binding beta-propeller fold protein YncE